jgi:hypothetical protein
MYHLHIKYVLVLIILMSVISCSTSRGELTGRCNPDGTCNHPNLECIYLKTISGYTYECMLNTNNANGVK